MQKFTYLNDRFLVSMDGFLNLLKLSSVEDTNGKGMYLNISVIHI